MKSQKIIQNCRIKKQKMRLRDCSKFENVYIDVLFDDIEFFEIKNDGINFNIFIKEKNKKLKYFNAYKLGT